MKKSPEAILARPKAAPAHTKYAGLSKVRGTFYPRFAPRVAGTAMQDCPRIFIC